MQKELERSDIGRWRSTQCFCLVARKGGHYFVVTPYYTPIKCGTVGRDIVRLVVSAFSAGSLKLTGHSRKGTADHTGWGCRGTVVTQHQMSELSI